MSDRGPRLLVTRPQPQADQWAGMLRSRGVDAEALPLIDIVAPPDAAAVQAAWRALPGDALVFFVSPNAVERFFAQRPAGAAWPEALPAAAPGPGSAALLRAAGVLRVVEPAGDAAQFDSEALWRELDAWSWQGARVQVVRGDGGREWLAEQLRARGADVRFVQAYARALPVPGAHERQLLEAALAQPGRHVWHFSSSQALDHLRQLAPGAGFGGARAIASHPRIAARARAMGFRDVSEAAPTPDAVVAALQHGPLQSSAP
jgi:uroporphyrinogen-III synthase